MAPLIAVTLPSASIRTVPLSPPAEVFYVLLEGTIRLTKRVEGREVDVATSSAASGWVGYLPLPDGWQPEHALQKSARAASPVQTGAPSNEAPH